MSQKLLSALSLLVAVTLVTAACSGGDDDADTGSPSGTATETADAGATENAAGESVTIAYQGPLTGDDAALGINMLCGIELAVQELNNSGETPTIAVMQLDSQGAPDQAPALANHAAGDESVVAMVGPSSGETAAAGPILEHAGLPFISPSATSADLSQKGWAYFFRTVATDATQGRVAAKFISEDLSAENVAIVDDSSEYGRGLADVVAESLEDRGANIVFRQGVEAGRDDYSAVVDQVVQSGADTVFYGGHFSEAGLIRKQLVENGGADIAFVSDDRAFDPGFIEVAGAEAAEGAFVTFPAADPLSAPQDFRAAYAEVCNGAEPGAFAIEAYQNTLLIGEALKSGATTRDEIRDFLDEFSGEIFNKQIEFTDEGDIAAQTFFIYTVEDGEFVPKEEVSVDGEGTPTEG